MPRGSCQRGCHMEEGACNYEAEGLTSQALPQLSRTLLHGGTFTHAIKGCFRTAGRLEVLLGRDSSLQLALGDLSVFEAIQPVFAPIRDLQTYVWRDSPGLQCLPKANLAPSGAASSPLLCASLEWIIVLLCGRLSGARILSCYSRRLGT